ncbi:MAG: DedA family protein [Actinomycetota bacterium]
MVDVDIVSVAATPLLAYVVVAGLVALDAGFPAIPSDAAVVSAGALAGAGHLDAWWAVVAVIVGAMGGDHLVYALGRHRLPDVLARSRFGRRLHATAWRAVERMGSLSPGALAMGRFVPFGRTASAAAAGLTGVAPRRYLWISVLGASTWALWTVGLGYYAATVAGGPVWQQVAAGTGVGLAAALMIAGVHRLATRRRRHLTRSIT